MDFAQFCDFVCFSFGFVSVVAKILHKTRLFSESSSPGIDMILPEELSGEGTLVCQFVFGFLQLLKNNSYANEFPCYASVRSVFEFFGARHKHKQVVSAISNVRNLRSVSI